MGSIDHDLRQRRLDYQREKDKGFNANQTRLRLLRTEIIELEQRLKAKP